MLRVIVVDDEMPALEEMAYMLSVYPDIQILEKCTDSLNAQRAVEQFKPDGVFLDINMPHFNGIHLGHWIHQNYSGVSVVFVTAYEQYAVDAFSVEALDYLMKPVAEERLQRAVDRLRKASANRSNPSKESLNLSIRCMGEFVVQIEGDPPLKWRTEREKELFAFLLTHRGTEVTKDRIIDTLWPHEDPRRAIQQLHNSIYYIRKTLKTYGIPPEAIQISGRYRLDGRGFWCDHHEIDILDLTDERLGDVKAIESKLQLFSGSLFQFEDWPWVEAEREKYKRLELELQIALAKALISAGKYGKAEGFLQEAWLRNFLEEKLVYLLMSVYDHTRETGKASQLYQHYCDIMGAELNLEPNPCIRRLYQKITST